MSSLLDCWSHLSVGVISALFDERAAMTLKKNSRERSLKSLGSKKRRTRRRNPQSKTGNTMGNSVTPFQQRVYGVVRKIGPGRVSSYKVVAEALGSVSLSRAVGQALRRNPFAPDIPCHRVIANDGSIGGFQGSQCTESHVIPVKVQKKITALEKEGVYFDLRTGKLKDRSRCFMDSIPVPLQDDGY
ncbi:Methylated-DNA--protein-cysteine methyltransferase, constitutive [Picochlorum sp. SENEW3]|nr:Methylated-DNA--protein-cysteine methyltransferase, constitutive [Picochlorum sp. SENEW3]